MDMRYCTLDDIKLAMPASTLIALSNDDPMAAEIDLDVIERGARAAEELIDANLRGRYLLPLETVPTVINECAVTLIRQWLYARRPEGPDLPEVVTTSHIQALKTLREIRDGQLTIGLPTGQAAPEPGKFKVRAPGRRLDQIMNGTD